MKQAYLLAGGESRRFGSNKARALIDGVPNVVRLARALQALSWTVSLVAQFHDDYQDLGLETIEDYQPDSGPLSGVIAALKHCRSLGLDSCLIATCDLVPSDWRYLEAMEQRWTQGSTLAVVFESASFSPFPGIYASEAIDAAQAAWHSSSRSVREMHERLGPKVATMPWPIADRPPAFNTPEELAAILEKRTGR